MAAPSDAAPKALPANTHSARRPYLAAAHRKAAKAAERPLPRIELDAQPALLENSSSAKAAGLVPVEERNVAPAKVVSIEDLEIARLAVQTTDYAARAIPRSKLPNTAAPFLTKYGIAYEALEKLPEDAALTFEFVTTTIAQSYQHKLQYYAAKHKRVLRIQYGDSRLIRHFWLEPKVPS